MQVNLGISVTAQGRSGAGAGTSTPPTHVFGLAGQSNMQGGADFDGGASWPASTVQWGRYGANNGAIIPAEGNLQHQGGYGADKMSLAIQFAIDYLALNPGVRILFVPGAQGGTSYSGNDWNKGDALYTDFVARMNAVFAQNPAFILKGVLWQHGEADAQSGAGSTYGASLDQMIADMRADITRADDTTPFLVGEVSGDVAGVDASSAAVLAAQSDVANRVVHTAVAAASDLSTYDGVHFEAASLRTLGSRYASALDAAALNDGSGINILADGGMDNPALWVLGGGATITAGVGRVTGASGTWRQLDVPFVEGKTYTVTWTVTNYTSGTTTPFFLGGTNANGVYVVGAGTHSQDLTANAGNTMFQLNCGGGSTLDIDDISIIEV